MYREIQQITQHSGSGRRRMMPPAAENSRQQATPQATTAATATVGRGQQMASQATATQPAPAPVYYGPQPGQRAAGITAGDSRRQRAPSQTAAGSEVHDRVSSKQAKTRQNMAGVDAGGSRVVKSRRTSDLSMERLGLGHVLVGAAVQQADRWVQQWDSLQLAGRSSSGHLRVSTPACNSGEKWRKGLWARQQLMNNGVVAWREAEWVELLEQQYGFGYASLARLVPWDQQIQLQKYAKSNPEPD